MKRYRVTFNVTAGKIPLIKLVRYLTNMRLKESKDFVESRFEIFEWSRSVTTTVTESQLGRYLIHNLMNPNNTSFSLVDVKEEENTIDLTQLEGRN